MTEDIDKLMEVMNEAFDPIYGEAWTRRQVEDSLIFGHTHYCLVAQDGSPPLDDTPAAGFSLSRHGFQEEELLLLAVSPKHRRRGLGKILLDKLRIYSNKRGAKRLLLEMRKGNPAESLYTGFGFYRIGERPNYYRLQNGDHVDAITFACNLEN